MQDRSSHPRRWQFVEVSDQLFLRERRPELTAGCRKPLHQWLVRHLASDGRRNQVRLDVSRCGARADGECRALALGQ